MTMPENKREEAEIAQCDGQEAANKYMNRPYWEADIPADSICIEFVLNMLKEMAESDTMPNEYLSREEWEEYYYDGFMSQIRKTRDDLFWEEEKRIMHSE